MAARPASAVPRRISLLAILTAAVAVLGGIGLLVRMFASPDVVYLRAEAGARWIGVSRPMILVAQPEGTVAVRFRTRFDVTSAPRSARLDVRALRSVAVHLDGKLVLPSMPLDDWKQQRSVDLAPWLTPGAHELEMTVANQHGPALLMARCAALGLATGEDRGWLSSPDGRRWTPVADVDTRRLPAFFEDFPSSASALAARWPLFVAIFIVAGVMTWWRSARPSPSRFHAAQFRWVLLLAWSILAANSLLRMPIGFGFDWPGHAEYIRYIAEHWRLPLATEGWEMFQSPLYYLVAAVPVAALSPAAHDLPRALLAIPLLCGAVQIQLAYAATRHVFPDRQGLQALGTAVGGLLPINFYASQQIGNEPLAAVLSAGALVVALGMLAPTRTADRTRDWVWLGVLMGLALLAKATAVLLLPPLVVTLGWKHAAQHRDARKLAGRLAILLGVALLLSGWHYARNWIEMGTPFLNGTEATDWWQSPGYRTPHDFLSFGAALDRPLYAAVHGFWNSLYSTLWCDGFYSGMVPAPQTARPWSQDFLLVGPLFGIVPMIAILLGMLRGLRQPQLLLAASSLATFVAAIAYIYLQVPHYSVAKASYTLGLIPCYAVLAAAGLEVVTRRPLARAFVVALLACGAASAYLAYFAAP